MKSFVIGLGLALCLSSCGGKSSKYADQARDEGTDAARKVVENVDNDALTLQNIILEAKSIQSKYLLMNDSIAYNEFDKAFRTYIKQHNDTLAKKMF